MKFIRLIQIVGVVSLTTLTACATSPLGRSQFVMLSDAQVAVMGDQAFLSLKQQTPIEPDRVANAYVDCVAEALVKGIGGQWEVAVFRDRAPNAFALPGGKIGVHTGMFAVAANQDQLATVIAHEIAHVLSRHTNERLSQKLAVSQGLTAVQAIASPTSPAGQAAMGLLGVGAQYGVLLPFNRVQETEADILGLQLMADAGFDPRASIDLWRNMDKAGGAEPAEFMSTHPSHETRLAELQSRIPAAFARAQQARAAGKVPQCDGMRRR